MEVEEHNHHGSRWRVSKGDRVEIGREKNEPRGFCVQHVSEKRREATYKDGTKSWCIIEVWIPIHVSIAGYRQGRDVSPQHTSGMQAAHKFGNRQKYPKIPCGFNSKHVFLANQMAANGNKPPQSTSKAKVPPTLPYHSILQPIPNSQFSSYRPT